MGSSRLVKLGVGRVTSCGLQAAMSRIERCVWSLRVFVVVMEVVVVFGSWRWVFDKKVSTAAMSTSPR